MSPEKPLPPQPHPQVAGGVSSSPPELRRFEARLYHNQPEKHATEARNAPHPWLALSEQLDIDDGVFVACLVTHAGSRIKDEETKKKTAGLYTELAVKRLGHTPEQLKENRPNILDRQNIWTLTPEQVKKDDPRVLVLVSPEPSTITDLIRERFIRSSPEVEETSPWAVGRICTVTLDKTRTNSNGEELYGDLHTLLLAMAVLLNEDKKEELVNESIPCVIVASDQDQRKETEDLWPAVTVVPLVFSPELLEMGNPSVTVPGRVLPSNDEDLPRLAVLTRMLLTVSYGEGGKHPKRVTLGHPAFAPNQRVSELELGAILADIRKVVIRPVLFRASVSMR